MFARDVSSGLGCLFQAVVIVGYFLAAWAFHSWVMALAPFVGAGIIILWATIRSRFEGD